MILSSSFLIAPLWTKVEPLNIRTFDWDLLNCFWKTCEIMRHMMRGVHIDKGKWNSRCLELSSCFRCTLNKTADLRWPKRTSDTPSSGALWKSLNLRAQRPPQPISCYEADFEPVNICLYIYLNCSEEIKICLIFSLCKHSSFNWPSSVNAWFEELQSTLVIWNWSLNWTAFVTVVKQFFGILLYC